MSGTIRHLQGPSRPSLLLGHELELRAQSTVGGLETTWQKMYGNTFRIGGCFAKDILMTSDPKAIQHILRNSGYRYPKTKDVAHLWEMMVGKGLLATADSVHQRQRKILNPAFSSSQLREYLDVFRATGVKLRGKFHELVSQGPKEINLLQWTNQAALDIVGLTSFRCHFGALDGNSSEMAHISKSTFTALSKIAPTPLLILVPTLWRFFPNRILSIIDKVPSEQIKLLRKFRSIAKKTARQALTNIPRDASRDIVNLLAIASDDMLLEEDEVLSQLANFTLAGEDTTAAAIAWTLYELSRRPDYQARIREEIQKGSQPVDYDSTPLLNAAINESLRLHPILHTMLRYTKDDDVIPLNEPVRILTGEVWSEIPVRKGQMVMVSAYMYNRLSSVWGNNPDEWEPERFLRAEEKDRISVGLHANLINFSDGVYGCIGWKYGLLQVQAILLELLKSFEFIDSGAELFNGIAAISLMPIVKGKEQEGVQVPVIVRALSP
ncbi:cytochrome P450 [Desarmillaria tabescens]|uniref:Cytochrome P450 n=1 Tax=Armillaria tabescens TaxID=1929756 RepID=A0AA39JYE8_ARMTA|nr:cytochrome P450 [Desarmillaria tabescens]KAK0451236.1 cytochrome P450 [Desarmillaria tabescens]